MAYVYNSLLTVQKWRAANKVVVTANTDYDDAPGAGVLLLLTAGPQGGLVTNLWAMPRANVAATQLQLFSSLDAGVSQQLVDSQLMAAYVFATNTRIPKTDFGFNPDNPLPLEPNERLYVGIGVSLAGGISFTARYGEY